MTAEAVIKFAPLATIQRVNATTWQDPGRTLFFRGALELKPDTPCPVLVDHDWDRQIGEVHGLFEMPFGDGPWICALATITDPPDWLDRHETKASFGRLNLDSLWLGDLERVRSAHVTEVSILSPGTVPCEPLAEVTSLRRHAPTVQPGEIIIGGPTLRRYFPTEVTVR